METMKMKAAWLLVCLVGACATTDLDEDLSSTADNNPLGSFEDFKAATHREADGTYVVESDIAVHGDAALYDYWAAHEPGELAVLTSGGSDVIWNSSMKENLTYCIDNSFGANLPAIEAALLGADAEWNRRAQVKFTHDTTQDGAGCTNANTNVTFNVRMFTPTPSNAWAAISFFPNYARSSRELLVNPGTFGNTPRQLVAVMGHELGHALGFRHEFIRPEDTTPCHASTESPDWRGVTAYDANSIMTYPGCGFDWWTMSDRSGAASLYGNWTHGSADLLWRNGTFLAIWMMLPTGATAWYANPPAASTSLVTLGSGDFNGDRLADLAFRDSTTNQVSIRIMQWGNTLATFTPGSSTWQFLGIADLNNDGISDFIWLDTSTSTIKGWLMTKTGTIASNASIAAPSGYTYLGARDFDGNGTADIALRSGTSVQLWLMSGLSRTSTVNVTTSVATNWVFKGLGDFNLDRKADMIWQDTTTGNVATWWMNGSATVSSFHNYSGLASSTLEGADDVTGDEVTDLVWRNTSTTDVNIWVMTSGGGIAWTAMPGTAALSLTLAATGNYD